MESRTTRPRSLVGPAILIVVGSLFLASNLGFLDRGAWLTVLQFWPLILVAIGLEILVRRSSGGLVSGISMAIVLMVALALAAGIAIASPYVSFGDGSFVVTGERGQSPVVQIGGAVRSETFSQSLDGAERANVDLNLGVGTMRVGAMSEDEGLVAGILTLGDNERVSRDYSVAGGTGYFKLRSRADSGVHSDIFNGERSREWDLRLNPNVPIDLKVNGGVGTDSLDLSGLQLAGLNVHAGVSQTEVKLPGHGRFQASIDGGVGDLTVMVPRGMAARIQVEQGLSSVTVSGSYDRNGNTYISRDYSSATDRVEMRIHGGIGKVTVQEY